MSNNMLAVIDTTFSINELQKLTIHRLPSAIQFGGRYRLVDFTLSNIKNSGIRNVGIFPSGNYRSLQDHVGSGKVWDFDRKKDGLFILPPKNNIETSEKTISFVRMKEHLEYFSRSNQKYVVMVDGITIWNVDFKRVLHEHLKSRADITVVYHNNTRLNCFILSKHLLTKFLVDYEYQKYRDILEVIELDKDIIVNRYNHQGYTRVISSYKKYFNASMELLNFDIGRQIFREDRVILTKIKDSQPTRYGCNCQVNNSLIANGAIIEGSVENSIISRDVVVEKGAIVKNSIIMQSAKILENAVVEHVIVDKNATLAPNAVLKGTKKNIEILSKGEKLISKNSINVIHIASECDPFIKTGGLADVIYALPRKLKENDINVTVCIPLHKKVIKNYSNILTKESEFVLDTKGREGITVYKYSNDGITYFFLEIEDLFNRSQAYGFEDDCYRYGLFDYAVLKLIEHNNLNVDVIHTHDWHTGLIPLIFKERYSNLNKYSHIKTVHTVHNLKYQGSNLDASYLDIFKLDSEYLKNKYSIKSKKLNFMEYGLASADYITTVSDTYKNEIKHPYFGFGLDELIRRRSSKLYGIINGIDYDKYNPATDEKIYTNYSIENLDEKYFNKEKLQSINNLPVDKDIPVISMISRIAEQKGFDILFEALDKILESKNVQFIFLGTGDKYYESKLREYRDKYPKQVSVNIGYDSANPHLIYAGSDMFLMPSRYEPCGLSQLISLRYGTIPIVRETGGLNDTVKAYNEFIREGNGFSFTNYNAHDMKHTIFRAIYFYKQKTEWKNIILQAMNCDYSWEESAEKYVKFYNIITER